MLTEVQNDQFQKEADDNVYLVVYAAHPSHLMGGQQIQKKIMYLQK